ncbi:putative dispersed gene family protein 1 (DGF-1) [Trypanosoma cruzi]|nr:putative dispersed gene family protein 1 (DGF-1) [Trypanosoma cruzi]
MWSTVGACPRSRHRVRHSAIAAVRVALLVALALVAAAAWMPAVHAVVLRLRGGTVDRAITVGRAVETVLMDGVSITNGVAVVFDVPAMLPGALRIELRSCVCDGGAQIYVRGYSGEPTSDRSLEVSVSGLSGSYCSLVFAHNLPARTNVTVRDSTIVTAGPMRYSKLSGLTDAVASPLVLHATSLLQTQLRVSSTVLRSSHAGGSAVYVGGGVELLSSAVVLDGVSLEASGGPTASAMHVASSSCLSLRTHSVFSVTNVSAVSSGSGVVLGERLSVLDSVLRFVGVEGSAASSLVRCGGGTVGAGGWLDLHDVWAVGEASSVASLSGVTLIGGTVSIARCAATGATLVSGPTITSGVVSVQCNRAGGRVLQSSGDYRMAGLPSVSVVPCDGCAVALACFDALTASFTDCVCSCRAGGVGEACLPFEVPPARSGGGGAQGCVSGVTLTESVTVGGGRATACFDSAVFSGPITVAVDLRSMDVFADALNVTLRHCVLAGGVQLRIGGLSESTARLMPHALVNMTNVTSLEGTIVLQGAMPLHSSVLLANSTLRATVGGSQYVPTTRGYAGSRYGPALVLDGVRLLSTRFVMTRSLLVCGGDSCAAILVERGLGVNLSSVFYMDNCAVRSRTHVMYALASDLRVGGGSVFSIQNSSWSAPSTEYCKGACVFEGVAVDGGSALQVVSSTFRLGFAMLIANTLTVTGGSWLVHRNNEFRTAYVVYVESENGFAFRDRSVWSIIHNNFTYGSYSSTIVSMTSNWSLPSDMHPTIYGVCNEARGSTVTNYQYDLNIGARVTVLDCGTCTVDAVCFAARTSSISGCECLCAAGGYGGTCLPAAVPDGLGPHPLPDATDTEVRCVHGGSISSVDDPDPGVRGLCFVNVTFTATIVLDLWSFNAPQQTLNITLLQCVLMGLSVKGSDARVHVNVTSSMMDSGALEFEGDFGANSQILVAGSTLVTTWGHAIAIVGLSLGANSTLLLLDNNIEGISYAVYLFIGVVDGGGIIVKGNTLITTEENNGVESAVYYNGVHLRNGGYFDVEKNTMSAVNGVYLFGDTTVSFAGLLRVADCTFFGSAEFSDSALVYLSNSLILQGGAQWRVEGNSVSAALVIGIAHAQHKMKLSGSGTTVVLAHNRQMDDSYSFADLHHLNTFLASPARFVVGCNLQGDEEVSYDDVFPEEVVVFGCGTCNDNAACYMPGTESVDRSSCSCSCKEEWHGASCLPFEVPDTVVPPVAERAVDGDTSCVVNQTLTNLTLNMWKTHHCYAGVTFGGVDAVLTFSLNSMPLHLPINITLSGCTFRGGAALQFVGGAEAAESAGVLIRVSQTVMQSSVVAFSLALPLRCDIAVTEVDAVQSSVVFWPDTLNKRFSVVTLVDVVLSASTLLVSNVNAHASRRGGFGLYSIATLTLVGGSSLYTRYCSFDGYAHMFYMYRLSVRDHSFFALLNNTMSSGTSLLFQYQDFSVSDHSVLRVVGNSGSVRYAIFVDDSWTVQRSSWLDWRDNDVGVGAMFHESESTFVSIDSSSVVTLTGCKMGSTGLSEHLLSRADAGYGFVAGCLTVAGRLVTTAAELELKGINNVTTVTACGECTKDGDCFFPLTTAVIGCECQCAAGGHGDVCVPAPVPAGPPPPPPPLPTPPTPPPPPVGECISDMVYPEVAQAVGGGLSWLCYRNVTFSGGGMSLTVLIGAMTGEVANITFDGCTWRDGAVLVLLGNAYAAVGSLHILVTGNTFSDALLRPEGGFPPHTNITISGNRFTVTRLISRPGLALGSPSCVAMNELTISNDSAVVLSGNVFQSVRVSSRAIHVVEYALRVSWHSLFAVMGNTFHMDGGDSTLICLEGSSQSSSLCVLNNSAVVIRGNLVSRPVQYFIFFLRILSVESRSAVVFHGNEMQRSLAVFYSTFSSYIYYNSWLQLSGNLCRASPSDAFAVLSLTVNLRDSTVLFSGNQFISRKGMIKALWIFSGTSDLTNGAIVAACNTVNGGEGAKYSIPSVYNATILTCSDPCTLATSCFPAYTKTASSDGCACTCAEGGHGDACLPVAVPEPPSTDGADLCVRDVRVGVEVSAGLGTSVVCYVGVTFAADVVVDVESISGSVRNVTLANCTFVDGASLYVVGWRSEPPAGERVDVLISGLESRSGGGVLVANRFLPGSRVTVVDSVLIAEARVAYRGDYGLGDASACLVVHKVNLTGSVLTIARTHVAAVFRDAVAVLVVGGVALSSRGALYVDGLSVQTALGLCVSVEGGVAASGGSVVAFVDSDFLLCKHAVSVRGTVSVLGSAVALVRSDFASTEDYAVAFYSTVSLVGGSMLLVKGNVHDGVSREMLYAAGAVTAVGSTLSFVRNRVLLPRMLSLSLSLAAGAHVRVACNDAGGRVLSTAEEYAAAGFGDAGSIDVAGCDACDRDTHCYAPGTASASMKNGVCVCACGSGGYGEACVPVGAPALPPAVGTASRVFVREGVTVQSVFVVPAGASEVTLRHVVLDGVSPVLYVPWMARDGVRIVVQNVSLRNGAVLYVMGGRGLRGAAGSDESGPVELSVCDVEALNGALVLTGTFPAGSVLTVTDSLLVAARSTPLVYLPGSRSSPYAPVLVLSGLRLVRSVLVVSGVALVTVVTGGRTVVVDGAVLELVGGGVALDAAVLGGDYALYASARVVASGGAVLRVSGSRVYAAHGLVFGSGVEANTSALVVNDNAGALTDGALLVLRGLASFASGSWLSVRGNSISGRLLSLPSYPRSAELVRSTLTLHGNAGSGSVVMDGAVALVGAGRRFVVGCLTLNGQALRPMEYRSAGIIGEFRPVACGVCDADVSCFAAATRAMSGSCRCRCAEGGYGRDCLPVYLPHVDGCNRTPALPLLSHTATLTETRSPTPPWTPIPTPNLSRTHYWPTETLQVTETVALLPTRTPTASVSSTLWWSEVACPTLAVTTTAAGGSLTQNDIRGGGSAVPTLLMVALPPPFRWARDPQLGTHLSFVLVSTAQPSGFGSPWGAMLRNATWERNATNPSTVLELAVPVHRGYFIAADETLVIRCDAAAVFGGCKGVLLGFFTIASNTLPVAASVLSAITGVVAGAAAVAVVVTGGLGSVLEMQALGVFARMPCASTQERASTVALPYFLSVFAALDPLWMVVGNALLAAVFGCVHYGVTVAFQRWRGVDAASAWAAMRFPSLTYVVAHAMHLGIFFGSVLALAMPDARVHHRVVGVVGVLYGAAFPAGVCYLIARHTGASFTKYWQFSRKPLHERLLYPVGYWHPAAQQRMYGGMLTNMRGSYVYWCVFQLSVLCVVGLIAAVHPPVGSCHVLYFCMAAVLLAGAGVVAFTNMMRSAFLTVMRTASFVLLAALCVVSVANHLAPSDGGARAYVAIVLLLTAVLLAITVYGVVVWYAEDRHWQELREPRRGGLEALLRDYEESDEETRKPHDMTLSSYASGTTGASSYRPPAQLQPMAGDTRSDTLSLFDRVSSASCSINYAPLER